MRHKVCESCLDTNLLQSRHTGLSQHHPRPNGRKMSCTGRRQTTTGARADGSARRSSPRAVPASPRASPPTAPRVRSDQADGADWHRRRVVRRCAGRSKHCRRSTRCPSGSSPSTRAAWPRHPTGDDPTVGDDHCIPRVRPGMQSPATSAEPSASPGPRRRRYWPQRPESSLSSPAPSPSTAAALSCCQSPTQQGHRS
jgi:hypothetical protein